MNLGVVGTMPVKAAENADATRAPGEKEATMETVEEIDGETAALVVAKEAYAAVLTALEDVANATAVTQKSELKTELAPYSEGTPYFAALEVAREGEGEEPTSPTAKLHREETSVSSQSPPSPPTSPGARVSELAAA